MGVTLDDVAREAGVSLATASRVLNGSTRKVGSELAERVRGVAAALGYLPNAPAQALARSTTATVGILLHDVSDPYFAALARGACDSVVAAELMPLVVNTDGDPAAELRGVRMLHAQRVQAIVLAGSGYTDPEAAARLNAALADYRADGGSVAAVTDHGPEYHTVRPANRTGAAELTRALLALGHRDFAVITGPSRLRVPGERLAGVREALSDAGVALPGSAVVRSEFTREGGRRAMASLLRGDERGRIPTAVLALADVCAVGALAALRERRIRVPEDISVAGFDDIPLAEDLSPPLSTVRIPLTLMGAEAVRLALRPPADTVGSFEAPVQVVLRATTGAPRTGAPGVSRR
ncbi:LacI family DNA-binding transcriptional regulator [Kitasatospora sp. NPDC057692]|uniref:LacI family DNA-binding transcriptional regulator n=1 Tax=Kitasatospora sp. NPDC057692 TaxID=3346215 RepID=UPI0036770313